MSPRRAGAMGAVARMSAPATPSRNAGDSTDRELEPATHCPATARLLPLPPRPSPFRRRHRRRSRPPPRPTRPASRARSGSSRSGRPHPAPSRPRASSASSNERETAQVAYRRRIVLLGAARRRGGLPAGGAARRCGQLRRHPMRSEQPQRRPGDLGVLERELSAALALRRRRRRPAVVSRCRAVGPLSLRRLGLARSRRNPVHEHPGQRQLDQPSRPSGSARGDAPGRRARRLRRRARRLSRPLSSTASSPSFTPGFAASLPVPGDRAGGPATTAPMPTFAASS